jgi:hypothetical protein
MNIVKLVKTMLKSINGILFGGAVSNLLTKLPKYPSVAVLILVNLIPLYGVLELNWSQGYILFIYWVETGIIGFLNVFRMMFAQKMDASGIRINGKKVNVKTKGDIRRAKRQLILFFIVHFGMFELVHGVFVIVFSGLFLETTINEGNVLNKQELLILAIPIGALFLSHLFSFIFNYIAGGEYKEQEVNVLFGKPYGRVIVTHLTLILGAILAASLGSPVFMLVLMIIFKTIFDVLSHIYHHDNLKSPKINLSN